MKKKWFISVLTLLNIVLLSFLILKYGNHFEFHRLFQQFAVVSPRLVGAILVLNLILTFFYACRLSYLMGEPVQVGFGIVAVGYTANNLLPLRLGELIRVYFAQKKYHIPTLRSLCAILFERIMDLFSLACLSSIAILAHAGQIPVSSTFIILGFISPFFLLIFVIFKNKRLREKLRGNRFYIHYIRTLLIEVQRLIKLNKLHFLLGYTSLIWIFTLLVFFIFFQCTLPTANFSFLDAICLTVCTSLSLAISTLPSSIGLFEGGIVYYLYTIKNINETNALALALMLHGLILVPQILCMCYFLIAKNNPSKYITEAIN